ncbi:MAG: hypothetical protein B7Z75_11875 [Acidocella sp. 20-57-95]|nr:MAG: hypothetical protein B7Z75_11875 [Acidocella sp. 20-57-95]HQT63166.1 hypothetical protein [Acidocella sp.]
MAILAVAVVPVVSHFIILATRHIPLGLQLNVLGLFKLGFVTVSALTHWGIYTALLASFALTLRPGKEPLITAMARRMHGLTPELAAYTRKVTIAWSLFCAMQLSLSVLLFWFAPLPVWSCFVNILDIPMVVLMFAAEYAVRLRCLRDPPRHSLAAIIAMVTQFFPDSHAPALADVAKPDA